DEQLKGKSAQTAAASVGPLQLGEKTKTLCERLGGEEAIAKLVSDFVDRALADPRVNWKRMGVTRGGIGFKRNVSVEWKPNDQDIKTMKSHIVQFLTLATGGPAKYEGKGLQQ